MKRMRSLGAAATAAALIALSLGSSPVNAGVDGPIPSFGEFKAATFQDKDGQFIVNGDEPVANKRQLRAYYKVMRGWDQSLIVNTVGGVQDKWSAAQALNLTYCVSTKFGADYNVVVTAMAQGAALWESAANVDFTHVPSADASCSTRNDTVLFSVEPTKTQQYIARAFFPSTGDRSRNILVNSTSLQTAGSWSPANIMGHELGHTLGFRHEHTRPEAGTCFEDNNWVALTPYDSASIMHYPQCNGTSSDLSMTSLDRQGAAIAYP